MQFGTFAFEGVKFSRKFARFAPFLAVLTTPFLLLPLCPPNLFLTFILLAINEFCSS